MRDCAAVAHPADETAEAEQGQRSAFCKGVATPEAKAGHRNRAAAGGGEGQNGEGETYKYTKFPPPTSKIPSRASGAKRAKKIGNKEKKAKTKNL